MSTAVSRIMINKKMDGLRRLMACIYDKAIYSNSYSSIGLEQLGNKVTRI